MKNYYELLEVSEKASQEVIKKAYTTLVKKYHPDLQPDDKKKIAEEKIKEINEAYEILSNPEKRQNYDKTLETQRLKEEQVKYANLNRNRNTNTNTNSNTNQNNNRVQNQNISNNYANANSYPNNKKVIRRPIYQKNYDTDEYDNFDEDYNKIVNDVYNKVYQNAYNDAYNQAYINNLKNMGYEIHYEKPLKEKIKTAFSAICTIFIFSLICVILWHIPFIKNYLLNLYNTNEFIKFFADFFGAIIKAFLNIFNKK